jgi:TRAP transporter TAXI family solute receptor
MTEINPFAVSRRTQFRELFLVLAPAVAVVAAAFWLTWQFVQPAPPTTLVISTGSEAGAYFAFANEYKAFLQKSGVTVEVRTSKGSMENLARLNDPSSGIDAAFMQGGIISQATGSADLQSVGRLFYEPLWIFTRAPVTFGRLSELSGKKLAIGADGSGAATLAKALLQANGVNSANSSFLPLSGKDAVEALKLGQADVIFFVAAPEAPMVKSTLADPALMLMNQLQADALSRRFPYLNRVVLPRGIVDLAGDRPPVDVAMVAPTAALVVRANMHPALIALLAQAARSVHDRAGMFQNMGEFPNARDPELPVAEEAERIYRTGTPFLQRYLPFWAANFVERMVILLVPLITILLPLFQIVPMIYRWRVRRRIFYWYGHLKRVEQLIGKSPSPANLAAALKEVDLIDTAVAGIPVPVGYSNEVYSLRSAVDLVRSRIDSIIQGSMRGPINSALSTGS